MIGHQVRRYDTANQAPLVRDSPCCTKCCSPRSEADGQGSAEQQAFHSFFFLSSRIPNPPTALFYKNSVVLVLGWFEKEGEPKREPPVPGPPVPLLAGLPWLAHTVTVAVSG